MHNLPSKARKNAGGMDVSQVQGRITYSGSLSNEHSVTFDFPNQTGSIQF